jgi:hypothetical protein
LIRDNMNPWFVQSHQLRHKTSHNFNEIYPKAIMLIAGQVYRLSYAATNKLKANLIQHIYSHINKLYNLHRTIISAWMELSL